MEAAVIAGVLAPGGTPRGVIDRLNAEFARAWTARKPRRSSSINAAEAMKSAPDALHRALEQDVSTWAEVVKATGVKLQ